MRVLGRSILAILLTLGLWAADGPAFAESLPEAVRWLQEYIRLDTTNPVGNEHRGVAFLVRVLREEGIPTQVYTTPEGRTSVHAVLRAQSPHPGEGLLLLHHIDVVPPGPGWSRDPFSGDVEDGLLWGRGAVDVKSLGIAHLMALVELKRKGVPLARDVHFLGSADEESGGTRGTGWLLEHHAEIFASVGAVLNEGGTNRVGRGTILWWGVEVSQKRPLWLRVSSKGRGGHASGFSRKSAAHTLIRGLAKLLEEPVRYRVTDGARLYLQSLAPLHGEKMAIGLSDPDAAVTPTGFKKSLPPGIAGLFVDTVQVTELRASTRINTIAPEAEASIDIRLLPDTDTEEFLARVKKRLGKRVSVEVLLTAPPGNPSPIDTPIFRVLEEELGPEGPVVPAFIPGFTDSRFFRERGVPAYGFSPFILDPYDLRGIHNVNERISVEAFVEGVERMVRVVDSYAIEDIR